MYFDDEATEFLKSQLPIMDLAEQLGLNVDRKKKLFSCPCHDDSHPSVRVYSDDWVWCYPCNKGFDQISLIGAVTGKNPYQAKCYLAQITGTKSKFKSYSKDDKPIRPYIKEEELRLVGLKAPKKIFKIPTGDGIYEEKENPYYRFFRTAESDYLIVQKAEESLNKELENFKKSLESLKLSALQKFKWDTEILLRLLILEKIADAAKRIYEIYQRYGGKRKLAYNFDKEISKGLSFAQIYLGEL